MRSIRVRTPAKINLFLRVLGRRSDGYHELETLFQAVDLHDELVIKESAEASTLDVPGFPDLETGENLVLKAVRWVSEKTGRRISVDIRLTKRIPIAGGLGGGSSDAAAALKGMCELFHLGLTPDELLEGATSIGADVPFFLVGGTAMGEGIGERLTPVDVSLEYGLVLVDPGFPVSTATVFRELSRSLTGQTRPGKLRDVLREGLEPAEMLHNDLQPVSERLYPKIAGIRTTLENAGVDAALMSGSGSAIFGLTQPDSAHAERVKERLPDHWKVFLTRPVGEGILID